MTTSPLQLVQDECDRLAAKYNIRAYVMTPSPANKGEEWGKKAFCQIVIDDRAALPISHEWLEFANVQHLQQMGETAFHRVAVNRASRQMEQLAIASRR